MCTCILNQLTLLDSVQKLGTSCRPVSMALHVASLQCSDMCGACAPDHELIRDCCLHSSQWGPRATQADRHTHAHTHTHTHTRTELSFIDIDGTGTTSTGANVLHFQFCTLMKCPPSKVGLSLVDRQVPAQSAKRSLYLFMGFYSKYEILPQYQGIYQVRYCPDTGGSISFIACTCEHPTNNSVHLYM